MECKLEEVVSLCGLVDGRLSRRQGRMKLVLSVAVVFLVV
jgi:hypothetical protein